MSKFDVFEKVLKAVRNKFQLPNEAIHPAEALKDDVSKLNDLGEKVKELTSRAEDNIITKEDVIYGRNPDVFKLTQPLIKDPNAKVNIIEPVENKLFIVQKKIEVASTDNNKTVINNEVYVDNNVDQTVQNIKNEIDKLKEILNGLKAAIKESEEKVKEIKRVPLENALPEHNLTPVPTDKITDELKAGKELVYIGNDKSKVYYKPEGDNIHAYTPDNTKINPRENQFDYDHHVITDKTLEELQKMASDENKTLEKYELFKALDYVEDLFRGSSGLRYNHEPIYKITENGVSKYVILKSSEEIFDIRNNVELSETKDSITPSADKVLSETLNFKEVQDKTSDSSNPYKGKIYKVTTGADAGYYIEKLSEEGQFDKDHSVVKVEFKSRIQPKLDSDNSENPKKKLIEEKLTFDQVKEKLTREGADNFRIFKVVGDVDDSGYYLSRAYNDEEKQAIREEAELATQGLQDTNAEDGIENLIDNKYKMSTMSKKGTEYYTVTDVDFLKLPEYVQVVKIKPTDFNEAEPKYYLKKQSENGVPVVFPPTLNDNTKPYVVKPAILEALNGYSDALRGVLEYENNALKPYTLVKMLLDKTDDNRNNLLLLYMANNDRYDNTTKYYTINATIKRDKPKDGNTDEFYRSVTLNETNLVNHIKTTLAPIIEGELSFTGDQIAELTKQGGLFENKFELIDLEQFNVDTLLTTRWASQFTGTQLNTQNAKRYGFKEANNSNHIYILKNTVEELSDQLIEQAKDKFTPKYDRTLEDNKVTEILRSMGRHDFVSTAKESLPSTDAEVLNKSYIGTRDTESIYRINVDSFAEMGSSISDFAYKSDIKLDVATILDLSKDTKLRDISGIEAHYTMDQIRTVASENHEYNDLFVVEYADVVEKSHRYDYLDNEGSLEDKVLPIYDRDGSNKRSKFVIVIKQGHENDDQDQ